MLNNKSQLKNYFGLFLLGGVFIFLALIPFGVSVDEDASQTWNFSGELQFEAGEIRQSTTRLLSKDKFVTCYVDFPDGEAGKCVVGEVTGNSISYGTVSEYDDDALLGYNNGGMDVIDEDKFAVCYVDDGLDDDGYLRVGSVSGTTISWGTAYEFYNGDAESMSCGTVDTDKIVVCYNDEPDSDTGKCKACVVNGLEVTECGTATDYAATDYRPLRTEVEKLDTDKFVSCWNSYDTTAGNCVVGTVDGTDITMGTVNSFDNNCATNNLDITVPMKDKFVVGSLDDGSSDIYVYAATVSGTTITYGAKSVYVSSEEYPMRMTSYDTAQDSAEILIFYQKIQGAPYKGRLYQSTVNFTTRVVTHNQVSDVNAVKTGGGSRYALDLAVISPGKIVLCYQDDTAAGDPGKCIVGEKNGPSLASPKDWHTQSLSGNTDVIDMNLSCVAGISGEIANISLYGDFSGTWGLNQTNDTLVSRMDTVNFTVNLDQGEYLWNCYSCNYTSDCQWGNFNYTLNVSEKWWDTTFAKCRDIAINNSGATRLANFPAYVNLSYDSDMATDFSDIRFINNTCNEGGELLDYEVEKVTTSIAADIWAGIPSLAPEGSVISVYYDKDDISMVGNGSGVWDENYIAVYHCNETNHTGETGTTRDSTSHGNDGTVKGVTFNVPAAAKIGEGYEFNTSGNIEQDSHAGDTNGKVGSYCMWLTRHTMGAGTFWAVIQKDGANFLQGYWTGADWQWYYEGGNTGDDYNPASGTIALNTAAYVCYTWDDSSDEYITYINGTVMNTGTTSITYTGPNSVWATGGVNHASVWDGYIDEIRYSTSVRTHDWINASYSLMNDPVNYTLIGDEFAITVAAPPSDSCTYGGSGQWDVDCSDGCNITSAVAMDGSDLVITGDGTFTTTAIISGVGQRRMMGNCIFKRFEGGAIRRN